MSRGASTARRYAADNGPVVFGCRGLDVRWNRHSRTLIVEADDGSGAAWSVSGEIAEMVIVALSARHREGRLRETLQDMLGASRPGLMAPDFYRCGRLMCWRPSWQVSA